MGSATKSSGVEQVISFSGICAVVGIVGDLLTPVGNYTLWCLAAGAAILLAGFVLLKFRGLRNEAAKGTVTFGAILSVVSIAFLIAAPEPAEGDHNGVLASRFDWIANAQEEFLGLTKHVEQIAKDTANIANSADQIARNTEATSNLSFSGEGFEMALASQDPVNIAMYCERGYLVDSMAHLMMSSRKQKTTSDRNFAQLQKLNCFDQETLCNPEKWVYEWHNLAPRMDDERVNALCGAVGLTALHEVRVDIEKQKEESRDDQERKYADCIQKHEPYLCSMFKRPSIFQ